MNKNIEGEITILLKYGKIIFIKNFVKKYFGKLFGKDENVFCYKTINYFLFWKT